MESSLFDGPTSAGLISIVAGVLTAAAMLLVGCLFRGRRRRNLPPAVPGLPLIGNLHQLKDKKPHQKFAKLAETFGPIYTIKTGAVTMVVLNSNEVVKEALVTRFPSMSNQKLTNALMWLTTNKTMVATSDYGDFHKMAKRYVLISILGASAQRKFRSYRETMVANMLSTLRSEIKLHPHRAVNFREVFESEIFRLVLKEALGEDMDSVYVEELGKVVTKEEMFDIMVRDPMAAAVEMDWRDFFPYLKWIPNKSFDRKLERVVARKKALTRAMIMEQKKRIARGEERSSYLDALLKEESLTEEQLISLVWETIIQASDTTVVATEWAMFELSRNPKCQDKLYDEIRRVCGPAKVADEHLSRLPYLNAVFHESLRRHPPVTILPSRDVLEDTQLAGYHIPAGSEIAINIYACNMDKKEWENPEEWNPERFLDGNKYEALDLHKTVSFGGGKRVCVGALQASLISCTSIAGFVQEFRWRVKEGEGDDVDTHQLTSHKLRPLQVYITQRDEEQK